MSEYSEEQLEAIQEVLQSLVRYEGGTMQSMSEQIWHSNFNNTLEIAARGYGVELDFSNTGRKEDRYGG